MTRKIIHTLYKKMVSFTMVNYKPPRNNQKHQVVEVWWKDCLQE